MWKWNRCCNDRAESQQIVRQAYSRAYNTPLRNKVVYNVSIFPDGRVVIQGCVTAGRVAAPAGVAPFLRFRSGFGPALSLLACLRALGRWLSSLFSMDSDLEAFSHNPAHGSFAALPFQATAFTNYVNQRFLSY